MSSNINKINSSTVNSSNNNKWKEEGNRLFLKRNYKEAIEMYTKAIEKASTAIHYTNRALCYFKLQQWLLAADDCRKAVECDPHYVKAYFFLGQSLCELNHFDEGIVHLKRAHELAKELHENYGDEITRTIRNAKRRRWNFIEEKRIMQEIELQTYLNRLMLDDKQKQINKIKENFINNGIDLDSINSVVLNNNNNQQQLSPVKSSSTSSSSSSTSSAVVAYSSDIIEQAARQRKQIDDIEMDYKRRVDELNRLFVENDLRRRKREIPDYLCGKISFELMNDPVITPSGITYDRNDIEQHLQRVGRFDPVTRQELTVDQLIPNLAMKEVIENFIGENDWLDGAL